MKCVLVIDDEPQIRDTLEKILGKTGYKTFAAEDGMKGLEKCREIVPDLVITDLTMPNMDGLETIEHILNEFPEMKVIAMSGRGEHFPNYFLKMAEEGGALKTIKKPFRKNVLLDFVYNAIGEPNSYGTGTNGR